jgi:hypothetical protein
LVVGDAGLLGHVEHVEKVVRNARSLLDGQLCGADVHAAVELRRVGVDHLAAEGLRERDGQVGLARRRRPHDRDDRRL